MAEKGLIQMVSDLTPAKSVMKFRRIITGHDNMGKAIFTEDTVCPHINCLFNMSDHTNTEFWRTTEMPVDNSGAADDHLGEKGLVPPCNGIVFRALEFPPACERLSKVVMHRTPTLDFAYVVKGEVYAVMDEDETLMKAGDVLIQRGTSHGWINRSNEACVILFVLIDAKELADRPSEY